MGKSSSDAVSDFLTIELPAVETVSVVVPVDICAENHFKNFFGKLTSTAPQFEFLQFH